MTLPHPAPLVLLFYLPSSLTSLPNTLIPHFACQYLQPSYLITLPLSQSPVVFPLIHVLNLSVFCHHPSTLIHVISSLSYITLPSNITIHPFHLLPLPSSLSPKPIISVSYTLITFPHAYLLIYLTYALFPRHSPIMHLSLGLPLPLLITFPDPFS